MPSTSVAECLPGIPSPKLAVPRDGKPAPFLRPGPSRVNSRGGPGEEMNVSAET